MCLFSYPLTLGGVPFDVRKRLWKAIWRLDYLTAEFTVKRDGYGDPWCLHWLEKGRQRSVKLGDDDQVANDVRLFVDKLPLETLFTELKFHAKLVNEKHREKETFKNPFVLYGKPNDIPLKCWTEIMDSLLTTDIENTQFSIVAGDAENPGKELVWQSFTCRRAYPLGHDEELIKAVEALVDPKNRDNLRRLLHIHYQSRELQDQYVSEVKRIKRRLHQEAMKARDALIGEITQADILSSERSRIASLTRFAHVAPQRIVSPPYGDEPSGGVVEAV